MTTLPPPTLQVLLIDSHPVVLAGLQAIIEGSAPEVKIVGSTTTLEDALAVIQAHTPDMIVLEPVAFGDSYPDVILQLIAQTSTRVLVLTSSGDKSMHRLAVLAGARGVVEKTCSPQTLVMAIRKVHEGQIWLDRQSLGEIFSTNSRKPPPEDPERLKIGRLTLRERQIVAKAASDALSVKGLADALRISEHTVRNHLTSIYDKLGVASRLELFTYAQKVGLDKFTQSA